MWLCSAVGTKWLPLPPQGLILTYLGGGLNSAVNKLLLHEGSWRYFDTAPSVTGSLRWLPGEPGVVGWARGGAASGSGVRSPCPQPRETSQPGGSRALLLPLLLSASGLEGADELSRDGSSAVGGPAAHLPEAQTLWVRGARTAPAWRSFPPAGLPRPWGGWRRTQRAQRGSFWRGSRGRPAPGRVSAAAAGPLSRPTGRQTPGLGFSRPFGEVVGGSAPVGPCGGRGTAAALTDGGGHQ